MIIINLIDLTPARLPALVNDGLRFSTGVETCTVVHTLLELKARVSLGVDKDEICSTKEYFFGYVLSNLSNVFRRFKMVCRIILLRTNELSDTRANGRSRMIGSMVR